MSRGASVKSGGVAIKFVGGREPWPSPCDHAIVRVDDDRLIAVITDRHGGSRLAADKSTRTGDTKKLAGNARRQQQARPATGKTRRDLLHVK